MNMQAKPRKSKQLKQINVENEWVKDTQLRKELEEFNNKKDAHYSWE